MSSKQDVLKILDGDAKAKEKAIREKHAVLVSAANECVEQQAEAIKQRILNAVSLVVAPIDAKPVEDNIRIGINERYGDILVTPKPSTSYAKAVVKRDAAVQAMQDEVDALHERAKTIRRHIMLHGVDEEVLRLLESL
jgi:hypothetical protein